MKVTIDDGGMGWPAIRRAVNAAEIFEEVHASRECGQRNCVIYASSDSDEPVLVIWWTAARNISVLVQLHREEVSYD